MERTLNYITLIHIFLQYTQKKKIFTQKIENSLKRFGTSNYELEKSLLRTKNKKGNWVNERQIRWKNKSLLRSQQKNITTWQMTIMKKKKAKDTKKCSIN